MPSTQTRERPAAALTGREREGGGVKVRRGAAFLRILLVHEVKALVGEQRSKALSQVVVGILCESHLLHGRQLVVAGPDLLAGRAQVLQDDGTV